MQRDASMRVLGLFAALGLAACGNNGSSDQGNPAPGPSPLVSYLGTTGVFAAWFDPTAGQYAVAPVGSYAGKRQVLRGTIDFLSGTDLGQAAGVEVYKGSDGHVYALDLTSTSAPAAQQLSAETAATVDDTCSLSGTAVAGANVDYVGVAIFADLQSPTNSSYFYRLPGADLVCNTADDVIHMVKTGMGPGDAPIVASSMPLAAVHGAQGALTGFVARSGASLVLVDANFANPLVLGTFASPIGVATALPVGTTQGYPTGQLFLIDGLIYHVDYAAPAVSAPLFTVPGWLPTSNAALFAASPTILYFSVYTPAAGAAPASSTVYAMPADGSAAPVVAATEPGRIVNLAYPLQGNAFLYGVVDPAGTSYTVRALAAGLAPTTVVSGAGNGGSFVATASTVYYETWTTISNPTARTVSRSGTTAGIVAINGAVIQPPLAGATFVAGGEAQPWPADTTTTATPWRTVFEVQGMGSATVVDPLNGYTYTEDAVGGGSLVAIDTASNQPGVTLGMVPASSAFGLTGTFRGVEGTPQRTGFLEAINVDSNGDPATRDLYLLDAATPASLTRATGNL